MSFISKYQSQKEIEAYYQSLAESLAVGQEYLTLGYYFEYQNAWLREALQCFHDALAVRQAHSWAIFNPDVESMVRRVFAGMGTQLKFRPFDLPLSVAVIGDAIIQTGMDPEPFLLVTEDIQLAEYYRRFFLRLWNQGESSRLVREALEQLDVDVRIPELPAYAQAEAVLKQIRGEEDSWTELPSGKKEQLKLWSVLPTTAEFLKLFVAAIGGKNVLEVGTSGAFSTLHLAMGAGPDGKVTTIERLSKKAAIAKKTIADSGLTGIELVEGEGQEVIARLSEGTVDCIFLDADRERYAAYLPGIKRVLKQGGFLLVDNITDYGYQMPEFLEGLLAGEGGFEAVRVAMDNGLLVARKK